MRLFISIILCFVSCHLYAQSPQKIEEELLISFRQLQHLALNNDASASNERIDSLKQANTSFRNSLLAYTASARSTFIYGFAALEKEGLVIRTSEDGLFRIYSWDTWAGGKNHYFDAVLQYRVNNEIYSKLANLDEGNTGKWFSNIYTLKTDNKIYYIGLYHEMHSTKDLYQGVKVFCIEDNDLNEEVRLFKTTKGLVNELGFAYDFLSVADHPERPVKLVYYDTDYDQLHLTVVKEDGTVTKQIITYQFTGKYFERVKGR